MNIRYTFHIGLRTMDGRELSPAEASAVLLDVFPDGATVTTGIGFWEGSTEPTMIVTALGQWDDEGSMRQRARRLTIALSQSAILLVSELVRVEEITQCTI